MCTRRRLPSLVTLTIAGVIALTGCAPESATTPEPAPNATTSPTQEGPTLIEGGTADENLPYFRHVLEEFAESDQPVQGRPIIDALVAAGFDKGTMQVSFDRTKIDLPVDNIFASVRIDDRCLLGQVVTQDRSVVATVEDVIGPRKDVCLIGETRDITW